MVKQVSLRALDTMNEVGLETADYRKSWTRQGGIIPVVLLILTFKFCVKGVFVRVHCIRRGASFSPFCMKGVFVRVDVVPD